MRGLSETSLARLVAIVAAGAALALVGTSLPSLRYAEIADEGYYLGYTTRFSQDGPGVLPELFRRYRDDTTHHRFPNPLRVGYIAVAGAAAALFGPSFATLTGLSLLCTGLSGLAAFLGTRRWLGELQAAALTALLLFSPLWLALSRRALIDAPATLAGVGSLLCFFAALQEPRRRGLRAGFAACFGIGMLLKESAVLLAVPLALAFAVERLRRGPELVAWPFGLALVAPTAIAGLIWLLAAGGPAPFLAVVEIILHSPETNPFARSVGGGSWTRYVIDFLLLSPCTTLLGIAGMAGVAEGLRHGRAPALQVFSVVAIAGVLLAFTFFTKNVRYVAVLELPLRLLAVTTAFRWAGESRRTLALAAVGLLCALDARSFWKLFVDAGIYDPVSLLLLVARGLVPVE